MRKTFKYIIGVLASLFVILSLSEPVKAEWQYSYHPDDMDILGFEYMIKDGDATEQEVFEAIAYYNYLTPQGVIQFVNRGNIPDYVDDLIEVGRLPEGFVVELIENPSPYHPYKTLEPETEEETSSSTPIPETPPTSSEEQEETPSEQPSQKPSETTPNEDSMENNGNTSEDNSDEKDESISDESNTDILDDEIDTSHEEESIPNTQEVNEEKNTESDFRTENTEVEDEEEQGNKIGLKEIVPILILFICIGIGIAIYIFKMKR